MRRMKTKVSAMLVALCMLVSLLPAMPVVTAEAADGDLATIALAFNATDVSNGIYGNATINEKGWELSQDGTWSASEISLPKLEYSGSLYGALKTTDGLGKLYSSTSFGEKFNGYANINFGAVGNTVGFNFRADKAAYYDLTSYHFKVESHGAIFEVYVDGKYLGDINFASGDATHDNEVKLSGIYLDVGIHMLKFKCKTANGSNCYMYLNGVVFTENTAPTAKTETITFRSDSAKVYNEDSAAYEAIGYKTASVANNGWVLGTETSEGIFADTSSTKLNSDHAYLNFMDFNNALAFEFIVNVDGYYNISVNNGSAVNDNGGIGTVYLDGRELGEIDMTVDSGNNLLDSMQVSSGRHTIKIVMKKSNGYNGRKYFRIDSLTLEANPTTPVLDKMMFSTECGAESIKAATISKNKWEINRTLTSSEMLVDATRKVDISTTHKDFSNAYNQNAMNLEYINGKTVAVDFDATAGTYHMSAVVQELTDLGGVFDVYVINGAGTEQYLGRMYNDPNNSANNGFKTNGFKNAVLTTGVNTIKFVNAGGEGVGNGSRFYFILQSVTMTPATGDEAQELVLNVPDSISVGQTVDATAVVKYANGNESTEGITINAWEPYKVVNNVSVTANGTEAAAVTYADNKLTADAVGTAVIEATATVNGEQYKARKVITVTEEIPEDFTVKFANSGVITDTIYNATIANNGWAINQTKTKVTGSLTDTKRHSINKGSADEGTNIKIEDGEVLAINFAAPAAGVYELVMNVGEYTDYGMNAEVYVNGVSAGKLFGDNNWTNAMCPTGAAGDSSKFYNKGLGKVTLNDGEDNVIEIKGLAPDVINAFTKGDTDRAGSVQLYMKDITFNYVGDAVITDSVDISAASGAISAKNGSTTVSTKIVMSDGSTGTGTIEFDNMTKDVIELNESTGAVTALKAGIGLIEATYTDANGVVYEDQVTIVVTNDDIFGDVYAYINGSTVTFFGGLKTIDGFKAVGFDIFNGVASDISVLVNDDRTVNTDNVYKEFTANGTKYDTTYFNVGEDGYIFFVDKEITADNTVIVKPYVITLDDEKVYYGNQYTMIAG